MGASDSDLKEKNSKHVLETWGTLLVVVLVNHRAKSGHTAHERNATDSAEHTVVNNQP